MKRVLLNLGCGLVAPSSWQNFDSSLHLYASRVPQLNAILHRAGLVSNARWPSNVRYLNLNRKWPFADGSVDVVYAHHVFEHLTRTSAALFLRESCRVLRARGVLRLVVPDLLQHAQQYLDGFTANGPAATERFLWATNLQIPQVSPLRALVEWMTGYPSMHKTMYDDPSLSKLIAAYGFKNIERPARGTSTRIPEIGDVEQGEYECSLYLEAEQPGAS